MPRSPDEQDDSLLVARHGTGHGQRDHAHDQGGAVQLAQPGQRDFQELDPLDLTVGQDEVQEEHQEEHSAEGSDLRVGLVQQVSVGSGGVGVALFQGQADGLNRVQLGGGSHNQQGEDDAHPEDGDDDAHAEEHLLPERVHALQDPRVDHRVVETEADFKNAQNDAKNQRLGAAVKKSHHQCNDGDRERPAESLEKHA